MKKRYVKHLSKAAKGTTQELNGIIRALRGTYPPPNPKTIVTYQDGSIVEYDIRGTLSNESIASLSDVTELNIGTHVTDIGTSLFYGDSNSLSSVTFPTSITSIGDYAFKGTNISSVTIPSSVSIIGDDAFEDCYNLSSVKIENGVTDIGSYAFSGCDKLSSFAIPSSITSIGDRLLNITPGPTGFNISSIIVDPNNPIYDSRDNCNAIIRTADNTLIQGCNNTIIPNTVTNIGNYAMQYTKITSFSIPSSVTSIGFDGFYGCANLSSLTIPSTVISIGNYAFCGCANLSSLTIPSTVISIGSFAFGNGCPATVTFEGKDKATVQGMANYRWSIGTNKIICTDGTL